MCGRIEKLGDRDWYVIRCKKGDSYNVELFSHRLGAPTMMYIKIRDQAAKIKPQDQAAKSRRREDPLIRTLRPASVIRGAPSMVSASPSEIS